MDPVTIGLASQFIFGLLDRAQAANALFTKEGGATIADLQALVAADNVARDDLVAAIAKAKAEGR